MDMIMKSLNASGVQGIGSWCYTFSREGSVGRRMMSLIYRTSHLADCGLAHSMYTLLYTYIHVLHVLCRWYAVYGSSSSCTAVKIVVE